MRYIRTLSPASNCFLRAAVLCLLLLPFFLSTYISLSILSPVYFCFSVLFSSCRVFLVSSLFLFCFFLYPLLNCSFCFFLSFCFLFVPVSLSSYLFPPGSLCQFCAAVCGALFLFLFSFLFLSCIFLCFLIASSCFFAVSF